jgi:hypothetical protein
VPATDEIAAEIEKYSRPPAPEPQPYRLEHDPDFHRGWNAPVKAETVPATPLHEILRTAYRKYEAAGLRTLPASKKSKNPTTPYGGPSRWKDLEKWEVEKKWSYLTDEQDAIFVIAGKCSGDLEVIDFDQAGKCYAAWEKIIPQQLLGKLVIERSQRGGYHIGYRTTNVEDGKKLAKDKNGEILIETRGIGNGALIYPSPGYSMVQGSWEHVPTITPEERDSLIRAAESLNEFVPEPKPERPTKTYILPASTFSTDQKPGEKFNSEASMNTTLEMLQAVGWEYVRDTDGGCEVRRPGKKSGGSGGIGNDGGFHCFTTSNSMFDGGESYSPWAVYTHIHHGGAFPASAKALAAHYGMEYTHDPLDTEAIEAAFTGTDADALLATEAVETPAVPVPIAVGPVTGPGAACPPVKPAETASIELIETSWPDVHGTTSWLWNKKIPRATISLIAGIGGLGKSTACLDLAAQISKGGTFPDGSPAPLGDVIIFSAEDPDQIVKMRLENQGADLSKIHKIDGRKIGKVQKYFDLHDVATLEAAMKKHPNTIAVIIDPVASYATKIDSHNTADVRTLCTPIAKLAERYNLAVIMVCHFNKSVNSGPENRITGAAGWRDMARAVWHVVEDPAEPKQSRLFLPDKNSYAPKGDGFSFCIELDSPLRWTGTSFLTCAEVMQRQKEEAKPETKSDLATAWLKLRLADGPAAAKVIESEASQLGIGERPLRTARTKLGVIVERIGFGGGSQWRLEPMGDFD